MMGESRNINKEKKHQSLNKYINNDITQSQFKLQTAQMIVNSCKELAN